YALPMLPRVYLSAFGDASHYNDIWKEIHARSGKKVPYVYGRSEFTQSVSHYRKADPNLGVLVGYEHKIGTDIIPFLIGRSRPVFVVFNPELSSSLPGIENMRELAKYKSNFSPSWDQAIYVSKGDEHLLPGMALSLEKG